MTLPFPAWSGRHCGVVFVDENINSTAPKNAPINTSRLSLLTPVYKRYCYRENIFVLYCWKNVLRRVGIVGISRWRTGDFPLGTPVLRSVPYS